MIDGRNTHLDWTKSYVQQICDRHFGVGSDGLLVLRASEEFDFYAEFFNPDGSQSFCGNGSRCAVAFARTLGLHQGEGRFSAFDGQHAFKTMDENIAISMKTPEQIERRGEDAIMNTGSPHFIHPVPNVESFDLMSYARGVRYSEEYADVGINVNVVHWEQDQVHMRTYERGVENETLSCGTGVTAAAIHFAMSHPDMCEVQVKTRGGNLRVTWKQGAAGLEDIWLLGPAIAVFEGRIEL